MIKLISQPPFAHLEMPIDSSIAKLLGSTESLERDYLLVGAVVFSLFKAAREAGETDMIEKLLTSVEWVASMEGWSEEQLKEQRSQLWASAHAYLVTNHNAVDRSREVEELSKALTKR